MLVIKILFIGCVISSYSLLEELIKHNKNICGVVTKKQSNINSDFIDIKHLCDLHGIDCMYYDSQDYNNYLEFIKNKEPDIIYCFGWSHLIKSDILSIPHMGVIGFHPAKLPQNRGRHPLIWALVLGLSQTASSFFMIEEEADTGDIISQSLINISNNDDATSLYAKVINEAKKQVIEITNSFETNSINRIKQNNEKANTWRKRIKEDGQIDFKMSADNIYNLVRGLTKPYVGAHFIFDSNEYKVWKCTIVLDNGNYQNIEYGKVIKVYNNNSILVKTGKDLILFNECDDIFVKEGDYLI